MKVSYCDNTDCKNPNEIQPLYLTVLTKDFNYNKCYWCSDCIQRDNLMIHATEFSNHLYDSGINSKKDKEGINSEKEKIQNAINPENLIILGGNL